MGGGGTFGEGVDGEGVEGGVEAGGCVGHDFEPQRVLDEEGVAEVAPPEERVNYLLWGPGP